MGFVVKRENKRLPLVAKSFDSLSCINSRIDNAFGSLSAS